MNSRGRLCIGLWLALAASASLAQQYDLSWWSIDGGGGMFSTAPGGMTLGGTIGQHDAGVMTGGGLTLTGGFWAGGEVTPLTPGDLDGDGDVDLTDLANMLINFGTPSGADREHGDLDGDGDVDLTDLAILLQNFGT